MSKKWEIRKSKMDDRCVTRAALRHYHHPYRCHGEKMRLVCAQADLIVYQSGLQERRAVYNV